MTAVAANSEAAMLGIAGAICGAIVALLLIVAVVAMCVVAKRGEGERRRWEAERRYEDEALQVANGPRLEDELEAYHKLLTERLAEQAEAWCRGSLSS